MINSQKLPPHDVQAEEAIVGSLLIDGECIYDLRYIVKAEDFFTSLNRYIYEACLEISNRGEMVNQITVAHELDARKKLSEIGGASYLSQLIAQTPSSVGVDSYARVVKSNSIARKTISMGHKLQELGYDEPDPNKIMVEVNKQILDLQKEIAMPKLITPTELATMALDRYTLLLHGKRRGIYTGYAELDKAIGGIFGGELLYLAARPKMGKSELLFSMARYAGVNHGNVFFVNLEMPWDNFTDRWVGSNLKLSPRLLRAGNYSDDRFDSIVNEMATLSDSRVFFYNSQSYDNSGSTLSSIYSIANYMKLSYGLEAIFIDQLSNLRDSVRESLYEKTTKFSHALKAMSIDLDIPVLCACQINRKSEDRIDKRPELSDLRDSGYLEADADSVLLLHREDYYMGDTERMDNPDKIGTAELTIAAQRQGGEVIGHMVPLVWDKERRCYFGRTPPTNEVPPEFR